MGLFELRRKYNKKSTLEFHIDVENVSEEEFLRLKQWIKENIPSTERFTPTWNPDDDGLTLTQNSSSLIGASGVMTKIRFRFKYEEHAMAFKLIM